MELLIAPADALPTADETAVARCLGQTLDDSYHAHFPCGEERIIVCASQRIESPTPQSPSPSMEITEGLWPEPPGLRLQASSGRDRRQWSIESDACGLRPVFYGFDPHRRPVISTRPEVVAALIGARLSADSLAEHLLLGFNLDNHSPFEHVRRLRPQERLISDDARGFRIEHAGDDDHVLAADVDERPSWIDALTATITDAFARGVALELSGGVDSRLVLAIGLNAAVKPRLAFTVGEDADEDVRIARLISERFEIRHIVLPASVGHDRLVADSLRFAMRAGFGVNACSYAWMPGVFRHLSVRRDAQIGGGGGECASGFYYSPLDFLCAVPRFRRSWARQRLLLSGIDLHDIFQDGAAETLESRLVAAALLTLTAEPGTWRRRTDTFYLTQRVPNAGGPVLSASACWYQPVQPLLHRPHIQWTRTLTAAHRADRRRQMRIIQRLCPELAEIPFSGGRACTDGRLSSLRRTARTLKTKSVKIVHRLRHQRGKADLGAAGAAEALARDPSVRQSLHHLANDGHVGLHHDALDQILASPATRQHELGALLTAAWAAETAEAVTEQLRRPAPAPTLRMAG